MVRWTRGEALGGSPCRCCRTADTSLKAREGRDESVARLDTLLSIMFCLDDTCLLYRGGKKKALVAGKAGAAAVEEVGRQWNRKREAEVISARPPAVGVGGLTGGTGIFWPATLFLDAVDETKPVQADQSGLENQGGAD